MDGEHRHNNASLMSSERAFEYGVALIDGMRRLAGVARREMKRPGSPTLLDALPCPP